MRYFGTQDSLLFHSQSTTHASLVHVFVGFQVFHYYGTFSLWCFQFSNNLGT